MHHPAESAALIPQILTTAITKWNRLATKSDWTAEILPITVNQKQRL